MDVAGCRPDSGREHDTCDRPHVVMRSIEHAQPGRKYKFWNFKVGVSQHLTPMPETNSSKAARVCSLLLWAHPHEWRQSHHWNPTIHFTRHQWSIVIVGLYTLCLDLSRTYQI